MLLAGFILPHPPLIIPDIGKGEEKKIERTIDAYHTVAKKVAQLKPKTIIVITPHHVNYQDYFHITSVSEVYGQLRQFGSQWSVELDCQDLFVDEFQKMHPDFPAGPEGSHQSELDHGVMVPLYFIHQYYQDYKLIRLAYSGLSLEKHYEYGKRIRETMDNMGESYVVIASGDLSHKLKKDGPYGYVKEGPEFDHTITDYMKQGDFQRMMAMDRHFTNKAAECGLRSFIILGGILDQQSYDAELLSYEGPFGVGYAVAEYVIQDPYRLLAKKTIELYLKEGKKYKLTSSLPEDMLKKQAGVFVSLKKRGQLRGCIGTIQPTTNSIADEIIQNALSAAFQDPRFPPLEKDELSSITYSVDVLKEAERINSISQLDPSKYGVIVKNKYKSGLLLPRLEGVNTIEHQLAIAKQKAGIYEDEDYEMYRFEVIRH